MAQKWSILDQKWPNMAGLSTLQSGPKGTKMVNISVFDHLGPRLGPSGRAMSKCVKHQTKQQDEQKVK